MKITLNLNGKDRDYYADITAGKCRKAYNLKRKMRAEAENENTMFTESLLDDIEAFTAEAFEHQFTVQELQDGYRGSVFDLMAFVNCVIEGLIDALNEGFPKNAKAPAK